MTRILTLLLCLSVGYGQGGITLEQLEKALKASEERTKIQIENLKLELNARIDTLEAELGGKIEAQSGKDRGYEW